MPTFTQPNSDGQPLPSNEDGPQDTDFMEAWSDAARAAAAAGRKGRGQGTAARKKAAGAAFKQAGGKRSPYAQARQSVRRFAKQAGHDMYDSEDSLSLKGERKLKSAYKSLKTAAKSKGIKAAGRSELRSIKGEIEGTGGYPGMHWGLRKTLKAIRQAPKARKKR